MKKISLNRIFVIVIAISAIATCSMGPVFAQSSVGKVTTDVVYGHKDGMALTYDIFEPAAKRKGVGLIFMVSGGWVSLWAPPDQMAAMFKPFSDAGYTVIAVRHGSSPRYVIPEIVADVRLALDHINSNAAKYEIDPARLGVFGFSAGGHLSLMLGTTANDNYEKDHSKPRIAAVAAIFPPTDLGPYVDPKNPLREQFPALKFDPSKADEFSPLKQVSSVDAPTVLVHGNKDELVPIWHSEKIVEAMKEKSVPVELEVIDGAAHGFDAAGNVRMVNAMLKWFDKYLANSK